MRTEIDCICLVEDHERLVGGERGLGRAHSRGTTDPNWLSICHAAGIVPGGFHLILQS